MQLTAGTGGNLIEIKTTPGSLSSSDTAKISDYMKAKILNFLNKVTCDFTTTKHYKQLQLLSFHHYSLVSQREYNSVGNFLLKLAGTALPTVVDYYATYTDIVTAGCD